MHPDKINRNHMKNANIIILLVITFFIFSSFVSGATFNYAYKISENGETTTFIFIEGYEVVDIPLPEITSEPQIRGGIYINTPKGIEVSVGNTGKAIVAYRSSFHTEKKDGIWYFNSVVKKNSTVDVILPSNKEIVKTVQKGNIIKNENDIKISFYNTLNSINISYVSTNDDNSHDEIQNKNNNNVLMDFIVIMVVIIILFLSHLFIKKKIIKKNRKNNTSQDDKINIINNNQDKNNSIEDINEDNIPNISEAQLNIIRAANPNEALIIKIVARNNGHIKRNILEKNSSLSKSSLASSLNNLEKKNILEIDRTFKVHYIKFSNWFGNLK